MVYVNHLKNMVNETTRTRSAILASLRSSGGAPVSGQSLADALGLSRTAVWKHLEALRGAGYDVVSERSGYRLRSDGDFLYPWEFPARADRLVRYASTDSTMERALERALAGAPGGTVVVAESQSAGRGRRGRPWLSGAGGLYCTFVFRPSPEDLGGTSGTRAGGGRPGEGAGPIAVRPRWLLGSPPAGIEGVESYGPPWSFLPTGARAQLVVEAAAASLCGALRDLSGEPFSVRWPNDVYLGDRKIAGVLAEYLVSGESFRFLTLGLGVNVARGSLDSRFASLEETGVRWGRRDLLARILEDFDLPEPSGAETARTWNVLNSDRGSPVRSPDGLTMLGRAEGIAEDGRLIVTGPAGGIRYCDPAEARIEKESQ